MTASSAKNRRDRIRLEQLCRSTLDHALTFLRSQGVVLTCVVVDQRSINEKNVANAMVVTNDPAGPDRAEHHLREALKTIEAGGTFTVEPDFIDVLIQGKRSNDA